MQYCKLLVQKLERKGIPCFTGMHAQAGDNWKMYYDKVQKAEIMLVIQTPGYYRWVQRPLPHCITHHHLPEGPPPLLRIRPHQPIH